MFLDVGRGLVEVSRAGKVVRELAQQARPGRRIHHDVTVTPRNTLLFIAEDWQPWDGGLLNGEALWEWDPEAGTTIKRWSSFAQLDPRTDWGERSYREDWLHANSLSYGPRGNVLVSFHSLNQVISLSPDLQRVEWRLGGVRGDVSVDDPFSGQHTAQEVAPGRVLLFDNGYERLDSRYSRAAEYESRAARRRRSGSGGRRWTTGPASSAACAGCPTATASSASAPRATRRPWGPRARSRSTRSPRAAPWCGISSWGAP